MDISTENLWEVIDMLLQNDKVSLASSVFRWSAEYVFLCGLKNAPVPVVITKFEQSFRPMRFHLDSQLEKDWRLIARLWRKVEISAAREHFSIVVDTYYAYAMKVSKAAASDKDGFWSVNKWH